MNTFFAINHVSRPYFVLYCVWVDVKGARLQERLYSLHSKPLMTICIASRKDELGPSERSQSHAIRKPHAHTIEPSTAFHGKNCFTCKATAGHHPLAIATVIHERGLERGLSSSRASK